MPGARISSRIKDLPDMSLYRDLQCRAIIVIPYNFAYFVIIKYKSAYGAIIIGDVSDPHTD